MRLGLETRTMLILILMANVGSSMTAGTGSALPGSSLALTTA